MLVHHCVYSFVSRQAAVFFESIQIGFVRERPFCLCFEKNLLTEVGHFPLPVLFIELDDLFHRTHWRIGAERGKIGVQVRFELVEQHLELGAAKLSFRWDVRRIHHHRAELFHLLNRRLHQLVHPLVESEKIPRHADAGGPESRRVKKLRVIRMRLSIAGLGRVVARVHAGQRSEQDRRVSNSARHRSGSVLTVRDGNDAGAADQSQRRFDSHNAVG